MDPYHSIGHTHRLSEIERVATQVVFRPYGSKQNQPVRPAVSVLSTMVAVAGALAVINLVVALAVA